MHLVLKSTKARGEWNFLLPKHSKNIRRIVDKFSFIYGVKVVSFANVANHLHLQIKLSNRFAYRPFIRAITGSIATSVTGRKRVKKHVQAGAAVMLPVSQKTSLKFWDHRPFTRIVESSKDYLNLKDYIRMNQIEAEGWRRKDSASMVKVEKLFERSG